MKYLGVVISVLAMLVAGVPAAMAQDDGGPQILTSDLALENEVTSDSMTVNFVILSDVPVTEVIINGEKQPITPGDTVPVTKQLSFPKQRNIVTVQVTDKNGKTKEKTYAVSFKGAAPEQKLAFGVTVKAAYEVDSNPTNDLSLNPLLASAVDQEVKGVVEDSKQADTRMTLQAIGAVTYGKWTGFLGVLQQKYSDADNEGLDTQVLFFGGAGRFNLSGTRDFVLTYVFTDLNLGGNDYAQMHTISPAYEARSEDQKGNYTHTFALDLTSKDFAAAELEDGGQVGTRWNYRRVSASKLDQYESIVALGTATEGDKLSDYSYLSWNGDWIYRWEKGLRIDWGMGFEYRSFPEDDQPLFEDLGETRVDYPFRASLGAGWQYNPKWSVMFNVRYVTNLSNKSPYDRTIYGLTVDGAF